MSEVNLDDLRIGDRVRVTSIFEGTFTERDSKTHFTIVTDAGVPIRGNVAKAAADTLTIELIQRPPKHWPPKAGQLWADRHGYLYAVRPDGQCCCINQPGSEWGSMILDEDLELRRVYPPEEVES